eukprot:TRINITY_DN269_c0_g1_i10.p1 TRINITY_DN269_c0_g1~~TRINITY_DN269_c0_g1_i10.p1  ORF type:complete len:412 (+),score=194.41 TRINITY_DN269_c0_g1_i10:64-1299(+)
MPFEAYIVECVRTAGGKRKGSLATSHPADLGAKVCDEVVRRSGVPAAAVEDVVVGCVSQIGAQAGNIGRTIVLSSKVLPETCPGTTIDRQCGSSQQAIHFAAQAVMSGTQDVVIAAGVEVMSLVPIGSAVSDGLKCKRGNPFAGKGFQENYAMDGKLFMPSQFGGAELLAKKHGLTRADLDHFGVKSHQNAAKATKEGWFKDEIMPVEVEVKKTVDGKAVVEKKTFEHDEGIRPQSNFAKLQTLKTLAEDGIITAATSSQITDGASAILIVNERALKKYNLKAKAKITQLALSGTDPRIMLEGPIPAAQNALAKANLTINDIDLYEVNEAFAPVPVSWMKALKADPAKMNVSGGAIALGHALGSTGTRCMTTLVNNLHRTKGRYGIVAICEGGGTANATIVERVTETGAKL